jgi:hypothetical protein
MDDNFFAGFKKGLKYGVMIVVTIVLLGHIWALFSLSVVTKAQETRMTATVSQSEMRACIEACGYEFK